MYHFGGLLFVIQIIHAIVYFNHVIAYTLIMIVILKNKSKMKILRQYNEI
jgi:hypothetical protein